MGQQPNEPDKPLMRSLGEFFGHIAKGVRTDPAKPPAPPPAEALPPERTIVRTTVQEHTAETPTGPVVLRRTVIDEVRRGA